MTESCLYEGTVVHRRHGAVEHAFRYPVFMPYLDLSELPDALDRSRLWSARRPAPARWRRADFHGDRRVPLDHAVRESVHERLGRRPQGPIRMLANVRMFGHCFNPVAFYYCFEADGESLGAVLAEVTNTPWKERHHYVLDGRRGEFDKALHVSPFMGMDHRYEIELSVPGAALGVRIESTRQGRPAFDAALAMRRRALAAPEMRRMLARYPFATLQVLGRIYGQAARLKLKGAPSFGHPGREALS